QFLLAQECEHSRDGEPDDGDDESAPSEGGFVVVTDADTDGPPRHEGEGEQCHEGGDSGTGEEACALAGALAVLLVFDLRKLDRLTDEGGGVRQHVRGDLADGAVLVLVALVALLTLVEGLGLRVRRWRARRRGDSRRGGQVVGVRSARGGSRGLR